MVKIVNELGDVKAGKQGQAVYQRRYGQQIRRTLQPKRAISSERQLEHRQLYRDALTWRKSLSLSERRFLEGYAISKRVIDSYGLPLPWHRFALKLYLEHVHFELIEKPGPGQEGGQALFENYDEGMDDFRQIGNNRFAAQTFTPAIGHNINKVGMRLGKTANTHTAYISIKDTDGEGHPTGDDLTVCSFTMSELPTTMDPPFFEIVLETEYPLLPGHKYAMVVRVPGSGELILWVRMNTATAAYPGGCYEYSDDFGDSWISYPERDVAFREYGAGALEEGTPGLLAIRHPALATIIQKRDSLIVAQWASLSSLTEEYLTRRIEASILTGDTIKATTVAGRDFTYQVR